MLYCDDCLNVLNGMSNETIDMVYIDPPFFTQTTQKLSDSKGKTYEFEDRWNSQNEYLQYIKIRLIELKRVLKNTGSLFLHCDTSASWSLKLLLDEIFGEENFRNEIIWCYKRWSNSQKRLLPNHQTIFFYSKTKKYKFNTIFGEYSPTTNIDQILQSRERVNGKVRYKKDSEGHVIYGINKLGVPLSDVWEIPFLNPKAKERTGYPTQKPMELLDRIIKISTNEGDTVLDAFCGSGTTLVSAKLLGRKYIGIDKNKEAIKLSEKRLNTPVKTESILLKKGKSSYKTKTDKDIAILNQFDCNIVQRNKGMDAILKKLYDGQPVAIKIQREPFTESVKLLSEVSKKKNCKFSILISEELGEVPNNIILLNPCDTLFQHKIKDFLSI